ncbi:hypothetical protein C6P42_004875 [Pichia californica]|nr:hypothetical protein C6P42_004875 [[Candida] californica]
MYSSGSSSDGNNSKSLNSRLDIDFIKAVPPKPELSRKICLYNSKSLQSFLKLSRTVTDDNLHSDLNSILNRNEENENSIFKFSKSKNIKESTCIPFLQQLIYPEWKKRADVIKFCQTELNDVVEGSGKMDDGGFNDLSSEEKNNLLRIDPYTYKNLEQKFMQRNAKNLELQRLYNNEAKVESIITKRSIDLMDDMCKFGNFDIMSNFINYANSVVEDN